MLVANQALPFIVAQEPITASLLNLYLECSIPGNHSLATIGGLRRTVSAQKAASLHMTDGLHISTYENPEQFVGSSGDRMVVLPYKVVYYALQDTQYTTP